MDAAHFGAVPIHRSPNCRAARWLPPVTVQSHGARGCVMHDSMCRLAVAHESRCIDLALPMDAPVGLLLPAVVELVDPDMSTSVEARRWHLSRVGQPWLDEAMSLRDNAVHDGDLLLLTTTNVPPPAELPDEPAQAIIAAGGHRTMPHSVTATATVLCTGVLGAAASLWAGLVSHATGHVVATAATAAAAAFGAVVLRWTHRDPLHSIALSAVAVMFGTAAGFLAAAEGSRIASLLLAAAVGTTMAILLRRLTRRGDTSLSALATLGALTSVASACGVGWTLPICTVGAALATLALAALGVAARFSVAATGLAPVMGHPDEDFEYDGATVASQALAAHRALTGFVLGSAAAAVAGAALVGWDCLPNGRPGGVVFALVVALVLALRARTHVDARRRAGLIVFGLASFAVGCAIVVASAPHRAQWVCLLAPVAVVSMLSHPSGAASNPLVHRAVDVLEYAALAAVVPVACWVSGVYALIRGVSLS
ncbi:type VII secretion integral membrane protein EccD [Mycobacterium sp. NPDC048908]|uniref:type VII secretion integral membrane protein EccD n=1 Tax=Mycobacterium sp. NPDC048908 TaxID=3364292 RepID=UPI003713E441